MPKAQPKKAAPRTAKPKASVADTIAATPRPAANRLEETLPELKADAALTVKPPKVKVVITDSEEIAMIAEWRRRRKERRLPEFEEEDDRVTFTNPVLGPIQAATALGMLDTDGATGMISQVARTCGAGTTASPARAAEIAASLIAELRPGDAIEAMLASQMVVANNLALKFAGRAVEADEVDVISANTERAAKMMRAFASHVEALNRHRGKGQQKVVVEHVTVNQGGQAIVGATVAAPAQVAGAPSRAALPPSAADRPSLATNAGALEAVRVSGPRGAGGGDG